MREVLPGIFHWTTFHEPIRLRVSSHHIVPAGIVVDPKIPEDGLGCLPGRPQQVVLTSGLHTRDAQEFADAFDIPIPLGFFSDDLLGDDPGGVKSGLRQAFEGLLLRDFDHLLFAHGDPLIGGGKAALRDFLARPAGHEDFGNAL